MSLTQYGSMRMWGPTFRKPCKRCRKAVIDSTIQIHNFLRKGSERYHEPCQPASRKCPILKVIPAAIKHTSRHLAL